MKYLSLVSTTFLASLFACSNGEGPAFQGGTDTKYTAKAQDAVPETTLPDEPVNKVETPEAVAPMPGAEHVAIAAEDQTVQKAVELTLEVKLPSTEVREGKKTIQAQAVLSQPSSSAILWSLEGPSGIDFGTIDANGKYTSPASVTDKINVNIVATLADDPTVTGKKSLNVILEEQLFVGCKKGNVSFPISADVFQLPVGTNKLPDFSKLTKSDTVCLDKFNIPNQSWELGFPGAPTLQEWFALHSTAKITIPTAGLYSFKTVSDDGSIVYIDGKKVVDNDGNHSASEKSGDANLTAGKHDLLLDWYQGPRTEIALQLFWKVPGSSSYVIVPASAFSAN